MRCPLLRLIRLRRRRIPSFHCRLPHCRPMDLRLPLRGVYPVPIRRRFARKHPIVPWTVPATIWSALVWVCPILSKLPNRYLSKANGLAIPTLAISFTRYGRLLTPKYADGISAPPRSVTGDELPSARLVSLVAFGEQDVADPEYTLHNMQWGQIMTHDMSMQAGGTQSSMFCPAASLVPHPLIVLFHRETSHTLLHGRWTPNWLGYGA